MESDLVRNEPVAITFVQVFNASEMLVDGGAFKNVKQKVLAIAVFVFLSCQRILGRKYEPPTLTVLFLV